MRYVAEITGEYTAKILDLDKDKYLENEEGERLYLYPGPAKTVVALLNHLQSEFESRLAALEVRVQDLERMKGV